MQRLPRLSGLALVLLIIVANGIVTLVVLSGLRLANARELHFAAQQVVQILNEISDLAERSGRDQRAYRVSGDAKRLSAYRDKEASLSVELAKLSSLIADDPGQSSRFADLTRLVDRDRAELAATLTQIESSFATGHLPDSLAAGFERSDVIEAAVDDMLRNEQTLLLGRLASIDVRDTALAGTAVFVAIVSAALIGIIFNLMRR